MKVRRVSKIIKRWNQEKSEINWTQYAYNCIKGRTKKHSGAFLFLVEDEENDECRVIVELNNEKKSIDKKIKKTFATVTEAEQFLEKQKEIIELLIAIGVF